MNELDLKQTLFIAMGSLFHDSRQYLDEQFKQYDLTRNEWLILALLRVKPDGITQNYAKSYIGIENSYFTKLLNKIENKGFIIREINRDDRRNRIIKINPKSLTKTKKIFKTIFDLNNEIQKDLNKKQVQALHDAFACIANRLQEFKP
ncbi:MAG: MarR family winged helix-turn-helix transcriptional regulator [Gammaproteobacteria bacterium]|nr:MarR family winged helix-turn-helix transcriptional regulator [Gammaproteobacteria bacterium]